MKKLIFSRYMFDAYPFPFRTQTILKAIMKRGFSTDAKNTKIIIQNGEVTLRGPVKNIAEVEKIAALAQAVP